MTLHADISLPPPPPLQTAPLEATACLRLYSAALAFDFMRARKKDGVERRELMQFAVNPDRDSRIGWLCDLTMLDRHSVADQILVLRDQGWPIMPKAPY